MTVNGKALKNYRQGNITAAFGTDLQVQGVTSVSNLLLRFYKKIGITDNEMMLIIQLFRLRNEERNLYPSVKLLAESLSSEVENIKEDLENLLQKEILAVTEYYDEEQDVIIKGVDFEPLFEKLSEVWACHKVREIEKTQKILEGLNPKEPGDFRRKGPSDLVLAFEGEFGRPLSPIEVEQIQKWAFEIEMTLILEALRRAVLMGKHNFKYIDSIILEWVKNNLHTLEAVAEYDRQFQNRRGKGARGGIDGKSTAESKKKAAIKNLYLS